MKREIVEAVANKIYAEKKYMNSEWEDFRSYGLLWLCEPENQKKLDDIGISEDKTAVLKFVKQIIYNQWYMDHYRRKKHFTNCLDSAEQYTIDGWLMDSYSYESNDAKCLQTEMTDEILHILNNLDDDDTELLVDLLSELSYQELADKYNIEYTAFKMRVCRLRKKCMKLYREAEKEINEKRK